MEFENFDINFNIDGKVAVITGGARGIGKAIAQLLSEKGARLALVDINPNVIKTAEEISGEAIGIVTDITQPANCDKVVEEVLARYGGIDILINNAGVGTVANAEDMTEQEWYGVMAVNLNAVFFMSQRVGRAMIKAGKGGKIVNMASQAALVALDQHVAYTTSKAGILGMTKMLGYEWAKYGINVNAVSPTVVLTEMAKTWSGERGETMKKKIPLGRFLDPREVAACVLFLSSDAAAMITCENLLIDGGFCAQ